MVGGRKCETTALTGVASVRLPSHWCESVKVCLGWTGWRSRGGWAVCGCCLHWCERMRMCGIVDVAGVGLQGRLGSVRLLPSYV